MNPNNQQFIKVSIIVVIIAGLLGALAVMSSGIMLANGKMIAICLLLIIYGITATICMVVTSKPAYKTMGTAGMIVSVIAFLLALIMIVGTVENEELLKTTFAFFIASVGMAHICLLHHFNLQNKYALYARMTATAAIALFSFLFIIRIFEPFLSLTALVYNQSVLKIILAALIADLAATLLVPLCNRLKVNDPAEQLTLTSEPPAMHHEEQTPGV
ncbi:MAG TPA: hypothetical protein VK483_09740 [Chitinophagaceae bacterium]|nr:hypothetical protein [Chitinophagaceae bacterium]